MAGRTGDPQAPPAKPAVPRKAPPVKSSPLGSTINPNTAQSRGGAAIGAYVDANKYPGLLRADQGSVIGYTTWLSNVQRNSPDYWALIQTHGAPMQALLWRAFQDNQDPNLTLNEMTRQFGTDVFKAATPGGGGGRGGGGGGGGTAAPTPQQIEAAKAAIKNRSDSLGHTSLSDEELTWVATTVVRDGWSTEQLDDWLLGDQGKITQPGNVTATVDQIKQFGARQLLNVSDATARDWAMRINSGEMTTDAVQSIFQQQAVSEFGWAADSIKAGISMKDMLSPSRDQIAKELELNPEQVDLMDPKWRSMVVVNDPQTNQPRAATLTEVTHAARKDPKWADTNSSQQLAANAFMLVRQAFEGA